MEISIASSIGDKALSSGALFDCVGGHLRSHLQYAAVGNVYMSKISQNSIYSNNFRQVCYRWRHRGSSVFAATNFQPASN